MALTAEMHVPAKAVRATLGWPPSGGADVWSRRGGDGGLIEVLDVPEHLRDVAPEGLAALSFLTDDFSGSKDKAGTFASDVTVFDTGMPGVDLFFCTMGGVPIEFMGAYAPEPNSDTSDATNP